MLCQELPCSLAQLPVGGISPAAAPLSRLRNSLSNLRLFLLPQRARQQPFSVLGFNPGHHAALMNPLFNRSRNHAGQSPRTQYSSCAGPCGHWNSHQTHAAPGSSSSGPAGGVSAAEAGVLWSMPPGEMRPMQTSGPLSTGRLRAVGPRQSPTTCSVQSRQAQGACPWGQKLKGCSKSVLEHLGGSPKEMQTRSLT